MFHGGGWHDGDKGIGPTANAAQRLYDAGYAVANANYQLLSNFDRTIFPNPNEKNSWPSCIVDAQLAVCWLRHNAATYGYDPAKFISWGDSSGAHLALDVALRSVQIPNTTNNFTESPQVQAAVCHSTPTNFSTALEPGDPNNPQNETTKALINKNDPAIFFSASPVNNVAATAPPIALTHGHSDRIVQPSQLTQLTAVLEQFGVKHDIQWYDGGHVFRGLDPEQIITIQQNAEAFVMRSITSKPAAL
jgi:acetyl esterase/lipase